MSVSVFTRNRSKRKARALVKCVNLTSDAAFHRNASLEQKDRRVSKESRNNNGECMSCMGSTVSPKVYRLRDTLPAKRLTHGGNSSSSRFFKDGNTAQRRFSWRDCHPMSSDECRATARDNRRIDTFASSGIFSSTSTSSSTLSKQKVFSRQKILFASA